MIQTMLSIRFSVLCLLGSAAFAVGQTTSSTPIPRPVSTNGTGVQVIPAGSPNIVRSSAVPPGGGAKAAPAIPTAYRPMADGVLAWNGVTQEETVKSGTAKAHFTFNMTNISEEPITISSVRTSCGCTVAKLSPMPWTLESGTNGAIDVTMNLAGKRGTVTKTVTVTTDHGFKALYVRTVIEEAAPGIMGESDRIKNLRIATENRQAVFQGECVTCHVTPALNTTGKTLYDNACGICHEAEHRASMVPDLKHLNKETNADYWRTWITSSMDGKLMPAFAIENGGFLNAMQIDSLVDYLVKAMPSGPSQASATVPAADH